MKRKRLRLRTPRLLPSGGFALPRFRLLILMGQVI